MRGKTVSKRALRRKQARHEHKQKERGLFMANKTKDQIDKEYTELCTKWGDLEVKKSVIEMELNVVKRKVYELQKEAQEVMIEEMKKATGHPDAKVDGVVDGKPMHPTEGQEAMTKTEYDAQQASKPEGVEVAPAQDAVIDPELAELRQEEASYASAQAH